MPRPEASANRHQLRVWIKWALESGLLDKLPLLCDAEGCEPPQRTDRYARAPRRAAQPGIEHSTAEADHGRRPAVPDVGQLASKALPAHF